MCVGIVVVVGRCCRCPSRGANRISSGDGVAVVDGYGGDCVVLIVFIDSFHSP